MSTAATLPDHRASRAPVLVVLLALLLAACGGSGDPGEELADAFRASFEDSFSYRFVIDADQSAMEALGEGAGQAAAFLSGFAIAGSVDDDAMSADVQALGTSLLEVRSIGEEELYVRVGVQELLGMLGGGFVPEDIVPSLEAMGFDEDIQGLVLSALRGEWIGIEGGFDPSQLGVGGEDGEVDEEEAEEAVKEAFGEDLPAFFERFVTVEDDPEQVDDGESFTVALQLRELLRAASSVSEDVGASDELPTSDLEADLAELPETVPGEVVVRDGVVTRITFRAAETIRESGDVAVEGDLDLVLELSDHGEVPEIAAPADATSVTDEQIQRLFDQLAVLADMGLGNFTP